MRIHVAILSALGLSSALLGLPAAAEGPFALRTLGEGVHLFQPADPESGRTNSLVVEQRDGLVVVDAQPSPEAAGELLAAIRGLSDSPVLYLVLSHPHVEASGGASAFPPATRLIASEGCNASLKDADSDLGAEVRALATDPEAWVEPARRPATIEIYARTVLDDPNRAVQLLPLGSAHSSGDLLVYLPSVDVMYAGSLLFTDGNPYAADAVVGNWLSALNQLVRQSPRLTVGLRGEPIDVAGLREHRDAIAWLRGQVNYEMVNRPPVPELRRLVLANEEFAERFDAEAPFPPILVDRVIEDEIEHRRKRHQPYP